MEATEDKQTEPAKGMTYQERAQKNRIDTNLDARVAEIVQASSTEHDPEG